MENVFVERLRSGVKYNDIYIQGYQAAPEPRRGPGRRFAFSNDERPHRSPGYRTPAAVHREAKATGG